MEGLVKHFQSIWGCVVPLARGRKMISSVAAGSQLSASSGEIQVDKCSSVRIAEVISF